MFGIDAALNSINFFIGTWPIPAEEGVYAAFGTKTTCVVQGSFILFASNSTVLYYGMLSIFSYIAVKVDFKEERLRTYEPWLHVLPWLLPGLWTIISITKNYIGPSGPWCLLANELRRNQKNTECYKNECPQDTLYENIVRTIFVSFCLTFLTSTIMVIFAYQVEKKKTRMYSKKAGKKKFVEKYRKQKAKLVVKQGLLYLISFYACIFTSLVSRIMQSNRADQQPHFPSLIIGVLAASSQGIILFLVYDRTRLRQRENENLEALTSRRNDSILTVADIENNIVSNKSSSQMPRRKSTNKLAFSIFDGTCPSSVWSQFVYSSEEDGFTSEGPSDKTGVGSEAVQNDDSPHEPIDGELPPVSVSEIIQERNFPDNEETKTEES